MPNKVVAVIVGINHWQNVTWPFVYSLLIHEPRVEIVLIDNCSDIPYPAVENVRVLRTRKRYGYPEALNIGMDATRGADWHICLNNDCLCHGPFYEMFEKLDPRIVYGSGPSHEEAMQVTWQWSAWLCISGLARKSIGWFDERFDAGYEDIDYEQRARVAGFGLEFLDLPIKHLDKHTRFEEKRYNARYEKCKALFFCKHRGFINLLSAYRWNPEHEKKARKI